MSRTYTSSSFTAINDAIPLASVDVHSMINSASNGDVEYFRRLYRNREYYLDSIKHEIDKRDRHDNYTPLIFAAKNNHVEITQLLCDLGADLNLRGGWVSFRKFVKIIS